MRTHTVDMLHGPLAGKLVRFAIPIALSSMLQQLFNSSDTAIVGRFSNSNALAAVGTNGEIVALLVTFSAGIAVGANVLIARFIGKGEHEHIPCAVHTAIMLSLLIGFLGAWVGWCAATPLLTLINTPSEIMPLAVKYLRIYCLGYPFLLLYDFASAMLRAHGDSRTPFVILVLAGILNVFLNMMFVIFLHMDVAGVAIATDIANAISAFSLLPRLPHCRGGSKMDKNDLRAILSIGIPSALQGAVFCVANIFVQGAINQFGPVVIAGSSIAMNFEYFGYYMVTAFGQAATTFTSQNHAIGDEGRCRKIVRTCLILSSLLTAVIVIPITLFSESCVRLFSTDPLVIAAARQRLYCIFAWEIICVCYEIPSGALRGRGYSLLPALLTILGTCVLRLLWIACIFPHFHTLPCLYVIYPISWVVTILLVGGSYMILLKNQGKLNSL